MKLKSIDWQAIKKNKVTWIIAVAIIAVTTLVIVLSNKSEESVVGIEDTLPGVALEKTLLGEDFVLDSEAVAEPGEVMTLEELANQGIVDAKMLELRQGMLEESEAYESSSRSFIKLLGALIETYGSFDNLFVSAKGLEDVKALLEGFGNDGALLSSYEDIMAYNEVYEYLMAILENGSSENTSLIEGIMDDMEGGANEQVSELIYMNETNIKGQQIDASRVMLRWQQDSQWIPELGYNLYRVVDGEGTLIKEGIGSITDIMANGDRYAKSFFESRGLSGADSTTVGDMSASYQSMMKASMINEEKASIIGFDNANSLEAYLVDNFDEKLASLTVLKGDLSFVDSRANAYKAASQLTFMPSELNLNTVVSGHNSFKNFNNNIQLDVSAGLETIEENLQEQLAKEEFDKIVESRSLIAAGADVDIDLALAAGFAFEDDISEVDGDYMIYVLEPIYSANTATTIDSIESKLAAYDLINDYELGVENLKESASNNPDDKLLMYTTIVSAHLLEDLKAPTAIHGFGVNNMATLRWDIANDGYTELITSGYNVYRKLNDEADYSKINTEPVLVQYTKEEIAGNEVNIEASFFYLDDTVSNKDRVEYKVESIDLFGRTSGMSVDTLVIESVINTIPPNVPNVDKPVLVRTAEDLSTLVSLNYKFDGFIKPTSLEEMQSREVEDRVILPISNNQSDVVLIKIYRSEAYGKDQYGEPDFITSINSVNKPATGVSLLGNLPASGLDKTIYIPGMYYEDKAITKGHYYKYWLSAVDEWGNESSWSYGMTVGYPQEDYSDMISAVKSDVVEEVRLDTQNILPGFIVDRFNTSNQIDLMRSAIFGEGKILTLDDYRLSAGDIDIDGNNNMMTSTVDASSYFGESLTVSSMQGKDILPGIISKDFLNLPDVNQVHMMIGLTEEDRLVDGTVKLSWPAYTNDDFASYGVYRGTIKDVTLHMVNSMETGEVLELLDNGELIGEMSANQTIDIPPVIGATDLLVYVVTLLPEEGERVSTYNHLNDIEDSHAIGGWVRVQWDKPEDQYQVDGYRIYKAYIDKFRLMEIDEIDVSSINYESLDWVMVEDNSDYSFYFESMDQMTEQHVAYKIEPVNVWGTPGEPVYDYIRVPALIPPAKPEMLQPYSKPGSIEVRFKDVNDAYKYTVYRASTPKVTRADISKFLTDYQANELFGVDKSLDMFLDHTDVNLNLYDINRNLDLGSDLFLSGVNASFNYGQDLTTDNLLNYTQVIGVDQFLDGVDNLSSNVVSNMTAYIENEYGILALSDYAKLSQIQADTVEWEKVADVYSSELTSSLPVDGMLSYNNGTVKFIDDTVDFKHIYNYTVTASNIDLESYKPEPIEGECRKYEPLSAPTNLSVSSGLVVSTNGDNEWGNALTWNHAKESGFTEKEVVNDLLVGYIVYRKSALDGKYYQVSNVIKDNHFTDYTAYAYQTYYYVVEAIDIAGLISDRSYEVDTSKALMDAVEMARNAILDTSSYGIVTILNPENTLVLSTLQVNGNESDLEEEVKTQLQKIPAAQLENFGLEMLHDEGLPDAVKDAMLESLKTDYSLDVNTFLKAKDGGKQAPTNTTTNTGYTILQPNNLMVLDTDALVNAQEAETEGSGSVIENENSGAVIDSGIINNSSAVLDFNTIDITNLTDINVMDLKPISMSSNFDMLIIESELERLRQKQMTLQGSEPELAVYEIDGGWVTADRATDQSIREAYNQVGTTGTLQVGDYLIEGIMVSSLYCDYNSGTILKGSGYIYYGDSRLKVPVIFKFDFGQYNNGLIKKKTIDLAMFPYMLEGSGLTLTSLSIDASSSDNNPAVVSGYQKNPGGGHLLPDMHIIYFEDALLSQYGYISIFDGAFPAFHFDDYLVYDYESVGINLDYMVESVGNADTLVSYSRYPIQVAGGKVDTSFGYATMDNKGLEFTFNTLGVIPGRGVFGDISASSGTVTRFIVPRGISVKLTSGVLKLAGDHSVADYTSLVGEVMLPYLRLDSSDDMPMNMDEFVYDPADDMRRESGEDGLNHLVINVFDNIKDGGIVLLGDEGNTYELSSVPFSLYATDIDNGFVLENVTLDPTYVGNYDIFESRYLSEDYVYEKDEWNKFVTAIEGSLLIESTDATVDLSVTEKGSTVKENRWYSDVSWKGILFDQANVSISAYKLQRKDETDSSPIMFELEQQELIYDRNGFIYQNFMESLVDLPIVLGVHYGNFQNAILQKGSAEIYNGEIEETYIGSVMIPALQNQSIGFIMHDDAENGQTCIVNPVDIVISESDGADKLDISMEIYGGYFDKLGVHLDGALIIPEMTDEKMAFSELVLPGNQTMMSTLRDDLGEGEALEYGSALFIKPYQIDFSGFSMELAYFDMYSMSDISRQVADVLGNNVAISNVDMKFYGAAALSDNMEKHSSEKNAQLYIHDIHGGSAFDYDACTVQVKIPNGKGFITGEVKATKPGGSSDIDLMNQVGDGLREASARSNEVMSAIGDADKVLTLVNSRIEALNGLRTNINIDSQALFGGLDTIVKTKLDDALTNYVFELIDFGPIGMSAKNELRTLIDLLNADINDYNQGIIELESLAGDMYVLPEDFDVADYPRIERIDKTALMAQVDALITELEAAVRSETAASIEELKDLLGDVAGEITDEFSFSVPEINIDFDGYSLNNQFATSMDAINELGAIAEETREKVGEFQNYIDALSGAEDGIVQFVVSGDEAFEMVMDESVNFLSGTNVQAVGNFGYRIGQIAGEEDMHFYAIGIGYVDTPNNPDSTLNLGVIELANLVSITGYNMTLPYNKAEGYTVGHGSDLLDCVKDLKPDLTNSKGSFFIAAGDAYIMTSRESHICALTEMRYISESDGSFEITGTLMGPERIALFAVPSSNNSTTPYGGARILYNAREGSYKLATIVSNIPIDPTGTFVVGGSVGLEWDDSSFMVKMGYPKDMKLNFADTLDGTFGMMAGVNPYSQNPIFMMKMGVGMDRSFDIGVVYADVGVKFDAAIGYGIWNLYDEKKEFGWYHDGEVFEGIGADMRLYGYMRGGIDIGKKYNIISASVDASASIINPREDLVYDWNDSKMDYVVRRSGISDKNDWTLHADLHVKYSIGFWLVSYSDDFYYDFETVI